MLKKRKKKKKKKKQTKTNSLRSLKGNNQLHVPEPASRRCSVKNSQNSQNS